MSSSAHKIGFLKVIGKRWSAIWAWNGVGDLNSVAFRTTCDKYLSPVRSRSCQKFWVKIKFNRMRLGALEKVNKLKVHRWHHNSAKNFGQARQCMGIMTSRLHHNLARSLFRKFEHPKFWLLFSKPVGNAQPSYISLDWYPQQVSLTGIPSISLAVDQTISQERLMQKRLIKG